jgi:hypothetical protein
MHAGANLRQRPNKRQQATQPMATQAANCGQIRLTAQSPSLPRSHQTLRRDRAYLRQHRQVGGAGVLEI